MIAVALFHSALGLLAASQAGGAAMQALNACDQLYAMLRVVPYTHLERFDGVFDSTWDGSRIEGCAISFETTDSTLNEQSPPRLEADEGTALYGQGWRANTSILADGAGAGVHAIQRDDTLCVVRWEQPAFIGDDGRLVTSEVFTLLVQCSGP